VIKRRDHQVFYPCILRSCRGCGLDELLGSCCEEFLRELIIEVRPRRACGFTCVVFARTSERLAGPRVLVWTRYRCCGTEWSCGIIIVEIFHSVEGGDVEQGCSNLETILPCLRLLISLLCLYILHAYIVYLVSAWYILCSIDICLGLFAHTCIQPREP